ncbi:MAG: hypothetical protein LBK99_15325, partial [Opitutaceae bacterium]|nr:hypothetical protein [Opitutaceae bacterium]
VDWRGADDLSAVVTVSWTDVGLLLRLGVRDDVHVPPPWGNPAVWSFDSVQVAVDPGQAADNAYDRQCREYGMAVDGEGRAWAIESYPSQRVREDIVVRAVRRSLSVTDYTMLVPWSDFDGPRPRAGDVIRLNAIVNDNDGRGRKCWIGITPGIGESKSPASWRQWLLLGDRD